MTRAEAAKLGGKARAEKLSQARRKEIAAMGFAAMVKKHCGNRRKAGVQWLNEKGKIAKERAMTVEELRSLHAKVTSEGGRG